MSTGKKEMKANGCGHDSSLRGETTFDMGSQQRFKQLTQLLEQPRTSTSDEGRIQSLVKDVMQLSVDVTTRQRILRLRSLNT